MNIVRALRKKAGITQEELARIVGVVQPTVSDWEKARKDPSGPRLKKLAEYFGVEESVILGRGMVGLSGRPEIYTVTPGDAVPVSAYPAPPAPASAPRPVPMAPRVTPRLPLPLLAYCTSAMVFTSIMIGSAGGPLPSLLWKYHNKIKARRP